MAEGGGLKFTENIFAKNTLETDPNMRGNIADVEQLIKVDATLSSGIKAVDDIPSPFGTGHGVVIGAYLLNNKDTGNDNHILSVVAEAGGTDDTIKVTLESSDATSTTALTDVMIMILGQIQPKDVA